MSDYFFNPEGVPVVFETPEEVELAKEHGGYTPRDPTKYEEAYARERANPNKLRTFAEGAARGLSLGLSDLYVAKGSDLLGDTEIVEEMRARRQANSGSALIGEVLPGLVPVGAGAKAAGVGLKAAAAGLAQSGALGATYGLGAMISDTSLERTPIDLEKATAYATSGALLGLGVHAAGMGVGAMATKVSKAASNLRAEALKEAVQAHSAEASWEAMAAQMGPKWAKQNLHLKDEILQYAERRGELEKWVEVSDNFRVGEITPEQVQRLREAQKVVENHPGFKQHALDIKIELERIEGYLPRYKAVKAPLRLELKGNATRADKVAAVPEILDPTVPSPRPPSLMPEVSWPADAARPLEVPDAWKPYVGFVENTKPRWRGNDTVVDALESSGNLTRPGKAQAVEPAPVPAGLTRADRGLKAVEPAPIPLTQEVVQELEAAAHPNGLDNARFYVNNLPDELKDFKAYANQVLETPQTYHDALKLEKVYKALEGYKAPPIESSIGVGEAAKGTLDLAVGAAMGRPVKAIVKKFGPKLAKNILKKLDKDGAIPKFATMVETRFNRIAEVAPAVAEQFASSMAFAFARGPEEVMKTHMQIASGKDGPKYLAAMGMQEDTPEVMQALGKRFARDEHLRGMIEATNSRTEPWHLLETGTPARKKFSHEEVVQIASRVKRNPSALIESLGDFTHLAPHMMKAIDTIEAHTPKPPQGAPRDWVPNAFDVRKFESAVQIVVDPLGAIEGIKSGEFDARHAEILGQAYPELLNDVRGKLAEIVMTEQLTREQKARLRGILPSELLGLPDVARMQLRYRQQQQGTEQPGARNSGQGSNRVVDVEKNLATQAQRMEIKR